MIETWKRLQQGHPNDRILSAIENPNLYKTLNRINISFCIVIFATAILACIIPLEVLKLSAATSVVEMVSGHTQGVRINQYYLDGVKPGLGYRYAFTVTLCLLWFATAIIILSISVYVNYNKKMNRITKFQMKSIPVYLIILAAFMYALLQVNYRPSGHSEIRSIWQNLFSTEWAIFVMSALWIGTYSMVYVIILSAVKIVRFRGEIVNG
jgi:hypothetical protein